jgi:hypothetical protein
LSFLSLAVLFFLTHGASGVRHRAMFRLDNSAGVRHRAMFCLSRVRRRQ